MTKSPNPQKKADLWVDVLSAIQNKEQDPVQYNRIFIGQIEACSKPVHLKNYTKRASREEIRYYSLGPGLDNAVFTRREAQVMVLLMAGYTNKALADRLGLSPRTTEFYIRNMRKKTRTQSKHHLVEEITKTDFIRQVDFSLDSLVEWERDCG